MRSPFNLLAPSPSSSPPSCGAFCCFSTSLPLLLPPALTLDASRCRHPPASARPSTSSLPSQALSRASEGNRSAPAPALHSVSTVGLLLLLLLPSAAPLGRSERQPKYRPRGRHDRDSKNKVGIVLLLLLQDPYPLSRSRSSPSEAGRRRDAPRSRCAPAPP